MLNHLKTALSMEVSLMGKMRPLGSKLCCIFNRSGTARSSIGSRLHAISISWVPVSEEEPPILHVPIMIKKQT